MRKLVVILRVNFVLTFGIFNSDFRQIEWKGKSKITLCDFVYHRYNRYYSYLLYPKKRYPDKLPSRSNAAMALGCAKKNAVFFHTRAKSSSKSSGVGAPYLVLIRWLGSTACKRPNSLLLMSSYSCFSFMPSMVSLIVVRAGCEGRCIGRIDGCEPSRWFVLHLSEYSFGFTA